MGPVNVFSFIQLSNFRKVTRSALQNATSVASTLLTTESVVADIKEPAPAAPAGAGMGGMM